MAKQQAKQYGNATNRNKGTNNKQNGKKGWNKRSDERKQGTKDSRATRINLDNAREDKVSAAIKADMNKKTCNDIRWYSGNSELMRAAASLPFSNVLGELIPAQTLSNYLVSVPGVMALDWTPAIGGGYNELVPYAANQSSKDRYSFLVHANSRNYNYEDQDLFILTMAGIQPFLLLASLIRAYGIVKYYEQTNKYAPDAILKALGFIPEDVRNNLGQLWFDINEMIARTQQIWIPDDIPIRERWFWMNSQIYMDEDVSKPQLYVYNQNAYWMYNETRFTTGGSLEFTTIQVSGVNVIFQPGIGHYTIAQWKEAFNNMMSALLNSEDRGIIFGDMLNAYGAQRIFAMQPIANDYRIAPIYSAEVLSQMSNTVFTDCVQAGVAQYTDGIHPIWAAGSEFAAFSTDHRVTVPEQILINFHTKTQPTPEELVIATRNIAVGKKWIKPKFTMTIGGGSSGVTYTYKDNNSVLAPVPRSTGSELFVAARIYKYAKFVATNEPASLTETKTRYNAGASYDFDDSAFDWVMTKYDMHVSTTAPKEHDVYEQTPYSVLSDYSNYAFIHNDVIGRIHQMALFSLFGMPPQTKSRSVVD